MENLENSGNRNEINAIVSVLGDVLVELKEMRGVFDRSFGLVLDKLGKLDSIDAELKELRQEVREVKEEVKGIRNELSLMADYGERIRALESAVFKKGA